MRASLILLLLGAACAQTKPAEPPRRAALHRTGGTTFELVPSDGQHPYCLVYTVSKSGLTRLLTMSRRNESFECPPGQALGAHAYRVPLDEGPVKVYLLFTSQPVSAASVSQQLLEQRDRQRLSVMDMRLPGAAAMEVLEFVPEEDVAATLGEALELPAAGTRSANGAEASGADGGLP